MTSAPSHHSIERIATTRLAGGELRYTLRRSPRARRLRVVVDPRKGVIVTVPMRWRGGGSAVDAVDSFLAERERWLRRHLGAHDEARRRASAVRGGVLFEGRNRRIEVAPPNGVARSVVSAEPGALVVRLGSRERRQPDRILEAWLRERARAAIDEHLVRHAAGLGVRPVAISLRDPRTRWGSASKSGRLSFSWRLILAPPEALETVVIHELAHLRVFGHGPEFWALVASRRPDHRAWRGWLREHSAELHLTLAGD